MPRLTPTGAAVGVGGVIVVVAGAVLGYSVLCVIGAAGVVAAVAGFVLTVVPPSLVVEREIQSGRVVRGTPVAGVVGVRNTRRRPAGALVAVDPVARNGVDVGRLEVVLPALGANRRSGTTYELPTDHRGELTVGPLTLERSDPFGLWVAARAVGEAASLLIVPRVQAMHPRPGGRVRHLDGPAADRAQHGSITFDHLREYVIGDDLRRVHWRTSARTGTLMVREHVDTSLPSTVVVIEGRADRFDGASFEEAIDLAASVTASSLQHGFPVRVLVTDGQRERASEPGLAAAGVDACLAGTTLTPNGDLGRVAAEVLAGRECDTLVVITGRPDRADLGAVATMARRFDTSVIFTVRPSGSVRDREAIPAGTLHLEAATATDAIRLWGTA